MVPVPPTKTSAPPPPAIVSFPVVPVIESAPEEPVESAPVTTPAVPAAAAAVDSTSISVQGPGQSGFLPKGSFFKFSNHDKIYVSTSNVNLNNNSPTLDFYPRLREAVSVGNFIKVGSLAHITFFRSIDNMSGITFQDGVLSNAGTITLIEAL